MSAAEEFMVLRVIQQRNFNLNGGNMSNRIKFTYRDKPMEFVTHNKVFSPQNIDIGTMAMLSQVEFSEGDKVLDVGCGYGIVGVLAAKLVGDSNVTMCDISSDAITLTKKNIELNDVKNIKVIQCNALEKVEDTDFTIILSNPPYHVDFSVPKAFIEQGYKKLLYGGKMYMVTKRKEWYKNKFISVFGGVKIYESEGYYVFMSEKIQRKDMKYKKNKPSTK